MTNQIKQLNQITWDEGYVHFIFYDYRYFEQYPLFIICSDAELNMYLIKCLDIQKINSSYPPTGICDISIESNKLKISDFSDLYLNVSAKSFELYNLGKIEITNPYQALIDLNLIKN